MGSYEAITGILAEELARVEEVFRGLSPDEWQFPTKLVPVDPTLPHWTVFELAGHFDISIGLTRMLIDGRDDLQPARDRTSFFINPRSETAPVVYDYAFTMVRGKTAADMPHTLHDTFSGVLSQARSFPAAQARARMSSSILSEMQNSRSCAGPAAGACLRATSARIEATSSQVKPNFSAPHFA